MFVYIDKCIMNKEEVRDNISLNVVHIKFSYILHTIQMTLKLVDQKNSDGLNEPLCGDTSVQMFVS